MRANPRTQAQNNANKNGAEIGVYVYGGGLFVCVCVCARACRWPNIGWVKRWDDVKKVINEKIENFDQNLFLIIS